VKMNSGTKFGIRKPEREERPRAVTGPWEDHCVGSVKVERIEVP